MKKLYTIKIVLLIFIIITSSSCSQKESSSKPIQECKIFVNGETIEMVLVEGGTFNMGCTPEQEKDAAENEKPLQIRSDPKTMECGIR